MYYKKSRVLVSSSAAVYGEPVAMGDDDGAMLEMTIVAGTSTITLDLEGSNDRLNWTSTTKTISSGASAPAYKVETGASLSTVVAHAWVRVKFTASGSSTLVSGALNTYRIG